MALLNEQADDDLLQRDQRCTNENLWRKGHLTLPLVGKQTHTIVPIGQNSHCCSFCTVTVLSVTEVHNHCPCFFLYNLLCFSLLFCASSCFSNVSKRDLTKNKLKVNV